MRNYSVTPYYTSTETHSVYVTIAFNYTYHQLQDIGLRSEVQSNSECFALDSCT